MMVVLLTLSCISGAPNSSSNARIRVVTFDCAQRIRAAARVKCSSSTSARNISNCLISIYLSYTRRINLFQRYIDFTSEKKAVPVKRPCVSSEQ